MRKESVRAFETRGRVFRTIALAMVAVCFALAPAYAQLSVTKSPTGSVDIGRYGAFELELTHDDSTYANPFWDVLIEATFTSPGGVEYDIEGFYYDEDTWMVRFAPTIEGTWTYTLTMTGDGYAYGTSGSFECIASDLHGPIRVHPGNPKRMIYDDGTPFNPIGTNIWTWQWPFLNGSNIQAPTSAERWDTYFAEWEAHRCNVHRRLLGNERNPESWYGGQAGIWCGDTGTDRYSISRAKVIDELFEIATDHNFAIVCALYDKPRTWNPTSDYAGNPLNTANGGPLADNSTMYDITDTEVTELHKKYVRYIVNRYAAYVDNWQLFNEFTSGNGLTLEWRETMAAHIRSLDPYAHFVNNSSTGQAPTDAWQDIRTPHLYLTDSGDDLMSGTDGTAIARKFDSWINTYTAPARTANLPGMFTEFGTGHHMPNDDPDAWRVAVWAAYFCDSGVVFWDDAESLPFDPGAYASYPRSHNGNAYISDQSRDLFLILQEFAQRFSQTVEGVAPTTNDTGNLRAFGLEEQMLGLYAAWIHNFADHTVTNTGKTLTIDLPAGNFLAEWIDPKDGSTVNGPTQIAGGQQVLSVPDFQQDIALAVWPDESVGILTTSVADADHSSQYYVLLQARGGGRPYSWSLVSGALPEGIVLDAESGLLSGAPIYGGVYSFTVEVTAADSSTDQIELTIVASGPSPPAPPPTPALTGVGILVTVGVLSVAGAMANRHNRLR